eukprot:Nitzschia sp. Nitz4//scaffold12_size214221//193946//194758//NITZ4_001536-RA/size214221-processed-gene-0.131-mRNA-1//1//CDS//3329535128//3201//frame0
MMRLMAPLRPVARTSCMRTLCVLENIPTTTSVKTSQETTVGRSYATFASNTISLRSVYPCVPPTYYRIPVRSIYDHRHRKKKARRKAKDDPFKVLGVVEGVALYKEAKKKFLQIAMKNHPDTIHAAVEEAAESNHTEEDKQKMQDEMRDRFIAARKAFESLAEDPLDGVAILKEEEEDAWENFDSWFKSETGFDTPFQFDIDPATMKEVAKMTDEMGDGLARDGGMWALAKMVSSAVKSGSEAAVMLRLESGDPRNKNQVNGILRRRRKR